MIFSNAAPNRNRCTQHCLNTSVRVCDIAPIPQAEETSSEMMTRRTAWTWTLAGRERAKGHTTAASASISTPRGYKKGAREAGSSGRATPKCRPPWGRQRRRGVTRAEMLRRNGELAMCSSSFNDMTKAFLGVGGGGGREGQGGAGGGGGALAAGVREGSSQQK